MIFLKKPYFLLSLLLFSGVQMVFATHYRAGEILYRVVGNYRIEATVITYSKWSSPSNLADRDTIDITWGDGSRSYLVRRNGPDVNPPNGVPDGVFVADDIKKNVYVGEHQYPGAPPPPNRYYIINFYDQNRMESIVNMSNSVNVPFYLEDTVKFPTDLANIGFNSSPILYYPPIDYANVNDTFYHNPLAVDPDGDSLIFELMPPLQNVNAQVPLYVYPDQFCRAAGRPDNLFQMNRFTGQIIWAVPCQQGIFNIAFVIHEYRQGINIGTLERDMQIIVLNQNNDPPQLALIPDTCIRAGDTLLAQITARDRNTGQTVTLSADGGPFRVAVSPAKFSTTPGNPANGSFRWYTTCDHIQVQPYMVLFRAADNYTLSGPGGANAANLVDLKPWMIRVIPPPVENLKALADKNGVTLTWDNPYICASSPYFRGFSIWKKTGCDPFEPEYCETGLAGRGYTQLTTNNIQAYTYRDNTTVVGQEYSYRVVAEFYKLPPNGLEALKFDLQQSIASNEACVFMPINVPVIINVSILETDITDGKVFVRWTKPLAGGINLDTILFPPPYRFDVYRSNGSSFSSPIMIHSTPDAASFAALNDTVFVDSLLDTKTTSWSYRILFYSNNDTVGATATASSIFLDVLASDQALNLTWGEQVPWINDSFAIFKLNKLTSLYDSIAVSYTHTFADTGLINDSLYCYFIKGYGHYGSAFLPAPLINLSEEDCQIPVDTTPPCPPVLSVTNDCELHLEQSWTTEEYVNRLVWITQNDPCSNQIHHFYIYYGSDSSNMVRIDSTGSREDTTFQHIQADNLAGCYAVTAVDRAGNESAYSNVFCMDNCPYYILPNTFTPNGDGNNDWFRPFKPYRFVSKIEMKIYNRWGEKVFETTDPEINWDGRDQKTGKELSEGVYLYAGYYFEQRLGGLIQQPLSGQKKGGGFIHLIRGK
ncbi:MAG: gliding motility-associated C-terminal domain-containing protein [Bacteroidetes bacterium]|nr:gliding motility-associated C-terminal domain-containing protein [Bacteroidota bacterium]